MFFRVLISQARYKWVVTLLVGLAMMCLVTLYVYLNNTAEFANRSMQLVMKNMGHNLLIFPDSADLRDLYLCSDSQVRFAEEVTRQMSDSLALSSRYYVSVLQERLQEVHDRRHETGILLAMGVSHFYLVGLYLVKILAIAALAAIAGFLLGSTLAVQLTSSFLVVQTRAVEFVWSHLPVAMMMTATVALVAQILPIAKLLTLDPNAILTEQ